MRDAARLATVIEVLSVIEPDLNTPHLPPSESGLPPLDGPLDAILAAYFRARRYLGSSDRAAISDLIFTLVRQRARLYFWLGRYNDAHKGAQILLNPRSMLVANLVLTEAWRRPQFAQNFDGDKYNPRPLSAAEWQLVEFLADKNLDDPAAPDWVKYECPRFLLPILSEQFLASGGEVADFAAKAAGFTAMQAKAPLDLRVNLLRQTDLGEDFRAAVKNGLASQDIIAEYGNLSPLCLRVLGKPAISNSTEFSDGKIEIQDEGSQLVALLAASCLKPAGGSVLDYCAGAGGKTLALAAQMGNRGKIIAADLSAKRLERAQKRLRRAGVHNVECRALDKENHRFWQRQSGRFDVVLVDAPCSGTGTWRRNPDMKWRLTGNDIAELAALQGKILREAARFVAPGGHLVYATCSLLTAENEAVIAGFLADPGENFAVRPVPSLWPRISPAPCPVSSDYLRLFPHLHGCDGFFAAIMTRKEKSE
ncbi:MAG: RsmB/NOP family class I SAM-dependent RNA methyltransferase [Candidatus Symbiobacter sp.]|nr:RsmB/NOP family class I SAM-dependent RNA methyltransferase [Candidatus Symbiobacter sp.]